MHKSERNRKGVFYSFIHFLKRNVIQEFRLNKRLKLKLNFWLVCYKTKRCHYINIVHIVSIRSCGASTLYGRFEKKMRVEWSDESNRQSIQKLYR